MEACPRCFGALRADRTCATHGAVLPWRPANVPGPDELAAVLLDTRVPVWVPWPLPAGWLVTGFASVGDAGSGTRAVAVALSAPGLLRGRADLVLVAEEPGVGLGAHLAGLPGPDPGAGFDSAAPHAKLAVAGPRASCGLAVPLWAVPSGPGRAAFVGEALGDWLWAVLWPAEAGVLLMEATGLLDLREPGLAVDLPYGPLSSRVAR
ncbi:DUF6758 family protein [Actinomadura rayongensis]|uniref:Uncharacterized protein n=1 Tax=Actinomadura rayongensis TaxID=1429076 RepID=A0A6I4W1B2_9ACTN|nr:DUF6758 family protein [Actinomadura rayongensis]MXQ63201.1 hypothetical protein [Actinomadura rayongensis]